MKKFLLLSFAMVAAAISHAVTVSWVVPTSGDEQGHYAWTEDVGLIRIVYSDTKLDDLDQIHQLAKTGGSNVSVYTPFADYVKHKGKEVAIVWENNVAPTASRDSVVDFPDEGVYYYLVVEHKTAKDESGKALYAVAGTEEAVTASGQQGIYSNLAGADPNAYDYFDEIGWLGGTWTAAQVPEPTIMALLALGVAGVALRRKQNFTK